MRVTTAQMKAEDQTMINQWWEANNIFQFKFADLPESTFIAYIDDKPVLCVSISAPRYGTGWIEAFVSNPDSTKEERDIATLILLQRCEKTAKENGVNKLFCMSPSPKLTTKYEKIGFRKVATVDTMIKEIN